MWLGRYDQVLADHRTSRSSDILLGSGTVYTDPGFS
jgi:hypothetical protein